MSEQSGPITREQVERAIDAAYDCNAQGVNAALGAFWYEREDIPADVRDGWRQVGYLGLRIALTRWRDELAAAEPARRVARWDAELEAYALTPIHDDGALMTHAVEDAAKARDWGYEIEGGPIRKVARWDATRGAYVALDAHGTVCMITTERAQAIAWGYEIEGGPEPVRDWKSDRAIAAIWPTPKPAEDSPERLRERREALGWTTAYAGHWVAWFDHTDVERAECGRGVPAFVARYAAALSAEEERRARLAKAHDKPHMLPAFRKAIVEMRTGGASLSEVADAYSLGIGEVSDALDAECMELERPAPRFKVGDRVTSGLGGPWKIGRVEWGRLVPEADCDEWVYHHASGNVSACESVLALAWTPTPASPPAPEVVDVPQPLVKRFGGVEASWGPGRLDVITLEEINGDDEPFDVPIALLRAMLAAIDAQQGGAS